MNSYRFQLQKYHQGSKSICPKCGRKACFVRYIDAEGEITFPSYVGRCDHQHSCQYHYTPSDYFQNNPDMNMKVESVTDYTEPVTTTQEVSYIEATKMQQSLSHYEVNPLYIYISGIFGKEETNRLFDLYHVGTSKKWDGSTVFWQVDMNGNVRTGKIMRYNPTTGHRVKVPHNYICWVHTELQLKDFHLKQCLFGEHLLSTFPQREVVLVESEKTAIIAAHFIPDYIWLATGGMNGCFNSEALEVLRDRNVMLVPDLGATDIWKKKVPLLNTICRKVNLNELLEGIANDDQRSKGFDIADFLLMEDSKQQILQKMIHQNQSLQLLIDTFGLELVDGGHL